MTKGVQFKWFGDQLIEQLRGKAKEAVLDASEQMIYDIQASFRGPKHGRIYTDKYLTWRASAPGEAPAMHTGLLSGSICNDIDGGTKERPTVTGRVGTLGKSGKWYRYMLWMEIGTPGGKVKPRPYLRPRLPFAMQQVVKKMFGSTTIATPTSKIRDII